MGRHVIIIYGVALALLLLLLKWLEWRFIIFDHAIEVYSGALALVFTGLGIWLALKLARPKVQTVVVEKEVAAPAVATGTPGPDAAMLARLSLSAREVEVLQLMAEGMSNQEIADRLFVSLNTIKTHCSRIFEKLDVKRRTQAIEKAKRLNIIR
jgi:NarL family two-component system response regulator LiaR